MLTLHYSIGNPTLIQGHGFLCISNNSLDDYIAYEMFYVYMHALCIMFNNIMILPSQYKPK